MASVAIAGLGAIGLKVAEALTTGAIPGLNLVAVASGNTEKAEANLAAIGAEVPVVAAAELPARAEIIVECAPAAAFREIAEPALRAGRILVTVSGGALLSHGDLIDLAEAQGGRIIIATGALLGLDAVRAAAEGGIHEVRMVTRKPPAGLAGAPYLAEHGIDIEDLDEPLLVFSGIARDGARGFPANVNVAAALSLAGVGADATRLDIWADPAASRNTHEIQVDAESARFTMTIQNVPSLENPRTGKLTPLSVIATLRGLVSPLKVGT